MEESDLQNGLKILKEYSKGVMTKYFKQIAFNKTLVVDPSLIGLVSSLLTNLEDNLRVIGMAELTNRERVRVSEECQAIVYILRPDLETTQTLINQIKL